MAVTNSDPRNRIVSGELTLPATVRLGYQRAATLGAWRFEGDWLVAHVESFDGFRITQTPLVLEIVNKDGPPTRRPLADVTVYQGQLSARLLPKRTEP